MEHLGSKLDLIFKLIGEDVSGSMVELRKVEQLDSENVEKYKLNKLKNLMEFACDNSVFYGSLFGDELANGVDPQEILFQMKPIDKQVIRENFEDMICEKAPGGWRCTSGTSGSPFVFPKDKRALSYMDGMMFSVYRWHGIDPGDRQARLWGRAVGRVAGFSQKMKDFVLGRKRLSVFAMNDVSCREYFYSLKKFKPRYFYCYPNAIYQFALSLERQGLNGRDLGVSIAICTGEVLFPHCREKIEEFFGCKVVNEYGSSENGIIGFECEFGIMHILPTVIVQIINPDACGFGKIAITELNSRSLPFINYINGDVGRLDLVRCCCGRPFDVLEIKDARVDSYIKCQDGTIVYDAILAYIFSGKVAQFRAIQERIDLITIKVVPDGAFGADLQDSISLKIKSYLGDNVSIIFDIVDKIPHEKSGKLRYFIPMN